MARNVNIAFEEFFENIINIPKATSETAKKSMNYLFEQIHLLSKNIWSSFAPHIFSHLQFQ